MSNNVEQYGWQSGSGPESCGYLAPAVLAILKRLGAKSVVDIGAGNGALCGHLHGQGFRAVGVEYSADGVAVARTSHPHLSFHQLGVEDEPTPELLAQAPFDAAVSTEVVEHLYAPHLLPRFAEKLLAPGGLFILTTPYHGYLKNLALSVMDAWDHHHTALWHGGHIKFWSRKTLSRLLEENGFEVIEFSGVGRMPYLWKSMVLVARRRSRAA